MSSAPQSSPPAIPEPDRHKGMNRYFLKKKQQGVGARSTAKGKGVGGGDWRGRKVGTDTDRQRLTPARPTGQPAHPHAPAAGSLAGLSASSSIQTEFPPSVLNAAAVTFLPSEAKTGTRPF